MNKINLNEEFLLSLETLAKEAMKYANASWLYGPVSKIIETGHHEHDMAYGSLCWSPTDYYVRGPQEQYEYTQDHIDTIGRYMAMATPGLILDIIAELRRLRDEYNLIINDDGPK